MNDVGTIKKLSQSLSVGKDWFLHLHEAKLPLVISEYHGPVTTTPPDEHTVTKWVQCKSVVANSRDICKEGSWVFFRDPQVTYPPML